MKKRSKRFFFAIIVMILLSAANGMAQSGRGKPRRTQHSGEIDWDRTIKNSESLATILGIAFGGAWAYFKFFKGRVFVPRLETGLSGKIVNDHHGTLVIAVVRLKNVGLSRVDIHQRGTALRLCGQRGAANAGKAEAAQWQKVRAFTVFEHHGWIESGESIRDELMIALPGSGYRAVRLEFRLVGSLHQSDSGSAPESTRYTWRDVCIVHQLEKNENEREAT